MTQKLVLDFKQISRQMNKEADQSVNDALDSQDKSTASPVFQLKI